MNSFSEAQRLYHSRFQHDGCGVGFNSDISGSESSKILQIGLKAVMGLTHSRAVRCCMRGSDNDGVWSGFSQRIRQRACVFGGNILGRRHQLGLGVVFRGRIEQSDRRQPFFCCHGGEGHQVDYGLPVWSSSSVTDPHLVRGIYGSRSLLRIPVSKNSKASKIQDAGRSPMKSSTGNGK